MLVATHHIALAPEYRTLNRLELAEVMIRDTVSVGSRCLQHHSVRWLCPDDKQCAHIAPLVASLLLLYYCESGYWIGEPSASYARALREDPLILRVLLLLYLLLL